MKKIVFMVVALGLISGVGLLTFLPSSNEVVAKSLPKGHVVKFSSAADFKNYLTKARNLGNGNSSMMRTLALPMMGAASGSMAPSAALQEKGVSNDAVATDQFSTTNVQVAGIDEPDIVKTDGQSIFLSGQQFFPMIYSPMFCRQGGPCGGPTYNRGEVTVFRANPASDLKISGKIPQTGNIILKNNMLAVFSGNTIYGYDVTDPTSAKQKWTATLGDRDSLVGARYYNGKLYIATEESINFPRPCPLAPLSVGTTKISIPCGLIYHPIQIAPTDVTYNVITLDLATGAVGSKASFTGSSSNSVLYMSPNEIFLTYFNPGDFVKFDYNFLLQNKDLTPDWVLQKLGQLQTYDISDGSKQNELYAILNMWQGDLDNDAQLKLQNNLQNRMASYLPLHNRELEQTGIVKIALDSFSVKGVGTVPGRVLNQFSLDEYNNNLRVAVTVGQGFWNLGWLNIQTKPVSDVYVLNDSMAAVGSVKGLGKGEQIYSARFIGDRGYLVTFKQTDPFFVLDMSNPNSPTVAGELKVPGYSGYLEPIGDHTILGVGKEDNNVKVALYDVSDAKNPVELSKFILNEYWSQALSDHHAFLKDERHQLFFIPGGQGGYVFSYANNQLSLAKAVSDYSIQRAVYIGNTLFVIGTNKMTAWEESNWNKLNELTWNQDAGNPTPILPMQGASGSGSAGSGTVVSPPMMLAPSAKPVQ